MVVVNGTLHLPRELSLLDSNGSIDADDLEQLKLLSKAFGEVISAMKQLITLSSFSQQRLPKIAVPPLQILPQEDQSFKSCHRFLKISTASFF